MADIWINVIGFSAATLTTFSFVPQFIKLLKTKRTEGLSLVMMIQIAVGLLLWITYGLLRRDIVLISANTVGFVIVMATIIIYFKVNRDDV
ncbi:SemiSWEET family sugar transporter [Hippea sp. KM1]|uniref:SemiSWEET family sugar transporter n=1 Tax=Hippea sp. KM1 TaxID=944481 RepID=UPI00046D6898|nr:SemiSWEET transporter [Hippea sp. KM1]